ncbi:hypothetical protein [Phaeobacter sp. B1627]|uniref:hypothetical protein n=1 Tax=Phaeobacter sp. B1627 TaxID=2583809 RepID=UPI00111A291F|nr:hypothetical protein [Phaeobacter sp. B1627]TNJ39940.1 hypothetical protein FGE21_18425 [Phaeobacter sp. B1627]
MSESETGDAKDRFEASAKALKAAFDTMEVQAIALNAAKQAGDWPAFDAAASELRMAQVVYLRIQNRFPAETASYLALRQAAVVQGEALDPFLLLGRDGGETDASDDTDPETDQSS